MVSEIPTTTHHYLTRTTLGKQLRHKSMAFPTGFSVDTRLTARRDLHGCIAVQTILLAPPSQASLVRKKAWYIPHSVTPLAVHPVRAAASPVDLKGHGISVASPSPQKDAPSTLDASQPFPSVSTPPPRDNNLTRRRPAPHPMSISDEEAFWVVTRGERPGVYHGRHFISYI